MISRSGSTGAAVLFCKLHTSVLYMLIWFFLQKIDRLRARCGWMTSDRLEERDTTLRSKALVRNNIIGKVWYICTSSLRCCKWLTKQEKCIFLVFIDIQRTVVTNTKKWVEHSKNSLLILCIGVNLILGDFGFELRAVESVLLGQTTQGVDALHDLLQLASRMDIIVEVLTWFMFLASNKSTVLFNEVNEPTRRWRALT